MNLVAPWGGVLHELKLPVLIGHATGDGVHPFSEGQRLAAAIKGARFVPVQSDNHIPLPQDAAWRGFMATAQAFLHQD